MRTIRNATVFAALLGCAGLGACGPDRRNPPPEPDAGTEQTGPTCEQLPDPAWDDKVTFTGTLLAADGQPVADEQIGLWSASIGCLDPLWLFFGADSPDATDTTDAAGTYAFERTWRQTKSAFFTDLCFTVTRRNPERWGVFEQSGRTQVQFYVVQADTQLPVLRDWDEEPQSAPGNDGLRLTWNALQQTHPFPASDYSVEVLATDGTVWHGRGFTEAAADLRRYVLEDFSGLRWRATAHAVVRQSCTDFRVQHVGTGATVENPSPSAPPSRGASCTVDRGQVPSPCPMTDGQLNPHLFSSDRPTRLDVQLSSSTAIKRLVLRGLSLTGAEMPQVEVLLSEDGQTFTPVFSGEPKGFLDLELAQATTATVIRIRAVGAELNGVVEISAWSE